jgi:hypothetical protein
MNNDMRASLWRIYLVAGTAAVGGYFLLPDDWWQTGVGAAIALAGVAGLLVGVWLHRPERRRLWWVLAAGLSCIAAGDFVYALYERVLHGSAPFPSLADALYLAGCPLIGLAWWGWCARVRPAGTGSAGSTRPSWPAALACCHGCS